MVDWGAAFLVVILGISIVFIVLTIIMFFLMISEMIFAPKKKQKPKVQAVETKEETQETQETKTCDDSELVAVLTAAIAASLNTTTYNLKIKSYRKLGESSSAWNNASRKENIYSRF